MLRWLQSVENLKNMGDISRRAKNSGGQFCMMLRFTKDCNGGVGGGKCGGGERGVGKGGGGEEE